MLLFSSQWITEDIKEKITKGYLQTNKKENIAIQKCIGHSSIDMFLVIKHTLGSKKNIK